MSVERPPLLVIDGYNVIAVDDASRAAFRDDPDAARARLVDDVASYAAGRFDALIVFDGQGNPHSTGEPHAIAGVTVVFSPWGVEADSVIESRAHEALGEGREVILVTSDAETQQAVARAGVRRMSSREFAIERSAEAEERASQSDGPTRSRVADRIDEDTARRLSRWARGM